MKRRGFTVVEFLTLFACVTTLVAIVMPAIQESREAARQTQCKNNVKQIGLALQNYHDVFNRLPAGVEYVVKGGEVTTWSWLLKIMPHLEQAPRYTSIYQAGSLQRALERKLMGNVVQFRCPSDNQFPEAMSIESSALKGQWGFTNYLGVAGTDSAQSTLTEAFGAINPVPCLAAESQGERRRGFQAGVLFGGSTVKYEEIQSGTSNCLIISERAIPASGQFGWWSGTGNSGTCPLGWGDVVLTSEAKILDGAKKDEGSSDADQVARWSSRHAAGVTAGLADGSVRFLGVNTDLTLLKQLSTRDSVGLEF